ncbi:MAG: oxidoreductase [Microbacteriaceae bacterium]|jgi:predicted dinucleotide-binding enzyme|nr:oxidoreductase [Microbacteriaceae bacterium]
MTTIGIIGAGHIGSQLARGAVKLGYHVVIANSRGPETLEELIAELGPNARAASAPDAAAAADVAVVTVPLKNYTQVPVGELAGKIVVDTNNYYFERDGHMAELDDGTATVSGLLQAHLPESRVAKGFNSIEAASITTQGTAAGTPGRRALVTASDHPDAAEFVTRFYNDLGFDTVNAGTLDDSWRTDRGQPAYGAKGDVEEITRLLALAKRNGDTE